MQYLVSRWYVTAPVVVAGFGLLIGPASQTIAQPANPTYLNGSVQQNQQIERLEASNGAISVRHDATDGIGAPQVGLDPTYPTSVPEWNKLRSSDPTGTAPYQPCVDKYIQAIDAIKQVAPLTKRPAWDVSGPQINAALQQANADVAAGDQCVNDISKTPTRTVQDNTPPSPSRAPPPDYGPMAIPVVPPKLQGTVAEIGPPPGPGPAKRPPFQLGAEQQGQPPQTQQPPPVYPNPYQSQPKPVPNSPAPQPIQPQYATATVTYVLNNRQGQQKICITRTNNGTGQTQVELPAVQGTQYRYYVAAVVNVGVTSLKITSLIDVSGSQHPINLTVPFSTRPCSF